MITVVLLSLLGHQPSERTELTGSQIVKLVSALQSDIRDVYCLYEGDLRFVGPKTLMPEDPSPIDYRYQGEYLYRNDGSTLVNLYRKGFLFDSPFIHSTSSLFHGELSRLVRNPDSKRKKTPPDVSSGPGAFDVTASAERFTFLWLFRSLLSADDDNDKNLKWKGWEDLDGSKCLVFEADSTPSASPAARNTVRFWVDMQRGGNPLKVQEFIGGSLLTERRDIKLLRWKTRDGKAVWFPIGATVESFKWGNDFYKEPVIRETIYVVDGSIQINKGLRDSDFSVALLGGHRHLEGHHGVGVPKLRFDAVAAP